MADKKISQLPAATTPLAGTEVLPIVQSGVTDQVSIANITAGRVPAMNNAAMGYTAVTAAAGTTTLTATSNHIQKLTGSAAQTFKLPDATTVTAGTAYLFDNDSTGLLTVVDNASGAVTTVASGSSQYVFLETAGTAAGSWGKYAWIGGAGALSVTAAKTASITNSLTLSGTDGTTMTFPATSATIARTDAANSFSGVQTFTGTKLATNGYIASGGMGIFAGTLSTFDAASGGVYNYYSGGGVIASYADNSGTLSDLTVDAASVRLRPNGTLALYAAASGGVNIGTAYTDAGAGNLRIGNGNLVIGTSGKGIDFSATPGTGTSELLADYEEGTWTPVFTDNANGQAGQTYSSQLGTYTKVGRVVTANFSIALSAVGTWGGGVIRLSGLPYVAADYKGILSTGYWGGLASNAIAISGTTYTNYGFCDLYITTAAATGMSGFAVGYLGNSSRIDGVVTYTV